MRKGKVRFRPVLLVQSQTVIGLILRRLGCRKKCRQDTSDHRQAFSQAILKTGKMTDVKTRMTRTYQEGIPVWKNNQERQSDWVIPFRLGIMLLKKTLET